MTREKAIAEIEKLTELKEDWNSYGAPPMDPQSVAAAKLLLDVLDVLPDGVVPTNDGLIGLYWRGELVQAEVNTDGTLDIFVDAERVSVTTLKRALELFVVKPLREVGAGAVA